MAHRVIFIHGISSSIITTNYSENLAALIVQKLQDQNKIPKNISPDKGKDLITFENVNYSQVGHDQEEQVLQAYETDKSKLYNVIDKAIDTVGLDKIRNQIITSVSDVLVYESIYWRNQIRNMFLDKIDQYVNTGEQVTVIGHSLGSVVAFDTVYYNVRHNQKWLDAKFKPQNLITMGSPIALFSLEMDNGNGVQKPRYIPENCMVPNLDPKNTNPDLEIVNSDGSWINFLDAQDLIGYPLGTLFKDKFKVEDVIVQTGTLPTTSHNGYWENDEVANRIAQKISIN